MGNSDSKPKTEKSVKIIKVVRPKTEKNVKVVYEVRPNVSKYENYQKELNRINNPEIISPKPIRPSIHYNKYYNEKPQTNIISTGNLPNISNMVNYDFENKELNLSYENINDTINKYKEDSKDEYAKFNEYMSRKDKYLNSQINNFEKKYDPYRILDISPKIKNPDDIKKAYKKKALLYHPDRVLNESPKIIEDASKKFKIITQAYLYLLKKYEADNELEIKISRPVEKKEYVDIGEKRESKFINKDKFNLELFNEVFEKYRIPDTIESGYEHLMSKDGDRDIDKKDENVKDIFSTNFNVDIFNKTFDNYKGNKQCDKIIEYNEPEALNSADALGFQELGVIKNNNFENKNNASRISYTDWKTAHIDENVFINNKNTNYKQYKDLKELERERSNIKDYSPEEKRQRELYEQYLADKESKRLENLKHIDGKILQNYNKINKNLIKINIII